MVCKRMSVGSGMWENICGAERPRIVKFTGIRSSLIPGRGVLKISDHMLSLLSPRILPRSLL